MTDVKLRRQSFKDKDVVARWHRRRETLYILTHDFVIARKSRKDGETLSQGQVQGPARGGELVTETYSLCMPKKLEVTLSNIVTSKLILQIIIIEKQRRQDRDALYT